MEARRGLAGWAGRLGLFAAYFRANVATALEYRTTLFTQVFGMFVNDALWVIFWVLYFQKFPVLKGWTLTDVLVLWASITFSFGIAGGIFGNSLRIPSLVVNGQLDFYLALPRNALFHLLISQMRLVNIGDLLFGPVLLVIIGDLSVERVAIFLSTAVLASIVTLSFLIISGSLVFFIGSSETVSTQLYSAFINFSTYPATIFDGAVKLLLYTVIPAGFVSSVPVELMREFRWDLFAGLAAAALLSLAIATAFFHLGLRRYESGNLIRMLGS